jgi:SnoaL-like domain
MESRRRAGPSKTRHVVSNLVITPTGEGANGSLYVFIVDPQEVPVKINSYSRYDDTLVKTSKGWRFKTKMRSSDTTIRSRTQQ